jgi:xanthine dehydrogenase YagR molybdenum-binding subunit
MSLASRAVGLGLRAARRLVRLLPDGPTDPITNAPGQIGQGRDRLDGPAKVTGAVQYTADHQIAGLVHAVAVGATIARGRIAAIDTAQAAAAPGVLLVMTHYNAPRMRRTGAYATVRGGLAAAAMSLPILNTDEIYFAGQPVAVVVAETLEQAQHAAHLIEVRYEPAPARLSMSAQRSHAFTPSHALMEEPDVRVGDTGKALAAAAVTVVNTYTTPDENHAAMEPHATVAVWRDGDLTVHDASQYPYGVKVMLAKKFRLPRRRVHVRAPFIGGGFGGKSNAWPHVSLAVAAAKLAGRPVKLVLSRGDVFTMVGGRSPTESRVALGADAGGRLVALQHDALSMCTSDIYTEPAVTPSRHLYACPNISLHQRAVRLDRIQNTFFRAPGAAPGSFALESTMDELAWGLGMDPLELRLRNEPHRDPTTGAAFSSRYLREAYLLGAEAFGWSQRAPQPRAIRDGHSLLGQGMAAAINPDMSVLATVTLRLDADGTVTIDCGTNELGAGTSTAQSQVAAQRLGLPIDRICFIHGDSDVGKTRIPGVSAATTTVAAAIWAARDNLVRELLSLLSGVDTPLAGARLAEVDTRDGGLVHTTTGATCSYREILALAGRDTVHVTGTSGLSTNSLKRSAQSYGTHFCEVRVDEDTGQVRVTRWIGVFDGGRIINPKHAQSQIRGGVIQGIGMALTEQTLRDERSGRIMNRSLAEYHVPTHADVPDIEVHFVDRPDPHMPMGAKGIGELPIVGVAAAIANAVFHATGKRIRDLPITPDKLM